MRDALATRPSEDALSATFAALADPTRRAMLARLTTGEATVNQLAEPFGISLPAISRHLKVLERAGLVSTSRTAQYRPRRLDTEQLKRVDEWMRPYRAFFDERLDRLEQHLAAMVADDAELNDAEQDDA